MGKYVDPTTTEEDMESYATARFPYVYGYDFDYNGAKNGAPRQGWGSITDYAGKKVILFNPKTNKAVVALAAEFGPAPWTGVCSGKGESGNNSNNKRLGASCTDQRQAWNARDVVTGPKTRILPQDRRAYDISPPSNYTGRIAGGEPKLAAKIGITTDEVVIVGFATDQSLAPGTVLNITEKDIVRVGGNGGQSSGGSITVGIITAARAYLTSKTFEYPGYSPCAKFVTSVLNDARIMKDYERACVTLNTLLSGAASRGILTKQFPEGASTTSFSITKVDEPGSIENELLNNLVPGDVVVVSTAQSILENNHTMIYAGKRDGKHTVIHTTASSNVIAKRAGVAHTTLASIKPKDNGNYDHWSAFSFRTWNGTVLDGSANN
jgi:hypothetical protein